MAEPRNRHDVTLESGLNVTIRLPYVQDCILAGNIPMPILERLQGLQANGTKEKQVLSPDELRHMRGYQKQLVIQSVLAIEGEEITLTEKDLPDYLTEPEFNEIAEYASRDRQVPKASVPA